jgi:hypothetical protein
MRRQFPLVLLFLAACAPTPPSSIDPGTQTGAFHLGREDEFFLEDLSKRSFLFFLEQQGPGTGLVLDRARADGGPADTHHWNVASIAATGFGLTALCIASERGWIEASEARERVLTCLRFFAERAFHQNGWFYHWIDIETGERRWESEVSSIDTALLLAGILTCRQFFSDDAEISRLATTVYERVDFSWMLDGHPALLSHGWKPETGFLPHRWDNYSEHTVLYLLAIGSPARPIPASAWYGWERDENVYGPYTFVGRAPLFTHQYSQAWVDYRNRRDYDGVGTDFFANSVEATRAHRQFCLDLKTRFPSYSENMWGITASDSAFGYVAWGGPPAQGPIDGSIVPCAAAGSLMLTPEIGLSALRQMKDEHGSRVYGRYGFIDAFNPLTGWVGPDIVGINQGITLLSAENLRTGAVWSWFMSNPEIPRAMELVGLRHSPERKVAFWDPFQVFTRLLRPTARAARAETR